MTDSRRITLEKAFNDYGHWEGVWRAVAWKDESCSVVQHVKEQSNFVALATALIDTFLSITIIDGAGRVIGSDITDYRTAYEALVYTSKLFEVRENAAA